MRRRPRITLLRLMGALAAGASGMAYVGPFWGQAAEVVGAPIDWQATFLWMALGMGASACIALLASGWTEAVAALAVVHLAVLMCGTSTGYMRYHDSRSAPEIVLQGVLTSCILLSLVRTGRWLFRPPPRPLEPIDWPPGSASTGPAAGSDLEVDA